jgi:hypothetical protein
MQYFLKAALGPNQDLNRIFVFDPDLFRSHRAAQGEDLKKRYAMNFSPPVQRRIVFQPPIKDKWREEQGGTMWHLSHLLATAPQELLFG